MRFQREGAQLQIRGTWSAGPGDDQARFLADLRALRDSAAIGFDELAARAHYPSDVLKEAENGPSLPGLPILSAYVRACEGDVLDWEERWRRLNPDVPDDPELPVRPAGASAAAVAGARAGVGVAPPDVYDPDRIRAALRGDHVRSEQSGRRAGAPGISVPATNGTSLESPAPGGPANSATSADSWGASAGWDAAPDAGATAANGNHTASLGARGPFDAATAGIPDAGEPAATEEFSWLRKSEPEARPADGEITPADDDLTWPGQAGNGRSGQTADDGYSWSGQAGSARPADPDITERILRHQAEELAAQERTDFWGQPLHPAAADLRMPALSPRPEEPAITRASWPSTAPSTPAASAPAEASAPATSSATAASTPATSSATAANAPTVASAPMAASAHVTAEPAHRNAATAAAKPLSAAGSAAQAAADERGRRQDRYFPARLLAVIVIAALIGSALVLLLK
jgi:hypothetical protein